MARSEEQQRVSRARQDAFLSAYTLIGSVKSSCEASSVSRNTYDHWLRKDVYGFRSRFDHACMDFREALQDMAVERAKSQKPGDNPVLLITLLNAHWPEKYRRDAGRADHATARELMSELRRFKKESSQGSGGQGTREPEPDERAEAVREAQEILARRRPANDNDDISGGT